MLLEKTPPLNIQVIPKSGKNPTLAHWIHHYLRRNKNQKKIKWISGEYKQVIIAFYQALNEPKKNNTKRTYETWRKEHRPYIDANN